jgi:spore photoproduct lyase
MIAPVFCYNGWQKDYLLLLEQISKTFPNSNLDMDESKRQFKYGQFGYGKYIYNKDQMTEIEEFFKVNIRDIFENSSLLYIV